MSLPIESLEEFAREVAAAISEGFDNSHILARFDLSPLELEEVFESTEFRDALAGYGETVVGAWSDARSTARGENFRRKLGENLATYYQQLDKLATNDELRPEKRADILLSLMKIASPPEENQAPVVRMPPALIENWAKRHALHTATRLSRRDSRCADGGGDSP